MTGHAALDVEGRGWDLRAVNGRGLDLRLRLPDRPAGLERAARAALSKRIARGNVTLSLRLGGGGGEAPRLSPEGLARAVEAMAAAEAAARASDLPLVPSNAVAILSVRGVWEVGEAEEPPALGLLSDELDRLIGAFDADRAREGQALRAILAEQIDEIARLRAAAIDLAPEREAHLREGLRAAMTRLTEAAGAQPDEARLAQEAAALAVRADVSEELDRLGAHVDAARALLSAEGPVGRRLEFLTQEFVREANTLCSKSNLAALTAIGLEMKTVIDRLREQAANVE
jgi:uncharacterized protein (TIGR00255 family)